LEDEERFISKKLIEEIWDIEMVRERFENGNGIKKSLWIKIKSRLDFCG
jgi:hypothetical protein